jgi:hypothetical protein
MKPRAIALALAVAAATLEPSRAHAQTTPKTEAVTRADVFYKEGVRLYSEKKWLEAESAFRNAWGLNPTFDVAYNLGSTEYQLGKYVEAAEYLSRAIRDWPLLSATSALRETARTRLAESRAQVGALRVRVNVDGAEVTVSGKATGKTPLETEVFVAPGPVNVSARLEGYVTVPHSVTVAKGEEREVSLTMVPAVVHKRSVVPGAVLGGVAGAALVTGIGLYGGGRAKVTSGANERDAILRVGHACVTGALNYDARCPDVESTAKTANALQQAGVGLMVGAGAAAVGTVIYFLVPTSSAGAKSGRLLLTPAVSPGNAGLVLSGSF